MSRLFAVIRHRCRDSCPRQHGRIVCQAPLLGFAKSDTQVAVACYHRGVADSLEVLPYRTLLRREESYAIHALIYAAENPGAPTAQMAADLKFPPAFLAKVLRRLAEVGYLDNRTGRKGGITLNVDPAQLTLLDVVESVSGPLVLDTCQTRRRCATQERKGYCRLNVAWINASLGLRDVFASVRLDRLIDTQPQGKPSLPKKVRGKAQHA